MKAKAGIKTVIVGVDFSKYSKVVVNQARAVAKSIKAQLVLVYVYADPDVSGVKVQLDCFYDEQVRAEYFVAANEKVVTKSGPAFEEIIAVAKKFPQPLIIVGHRGDRGIVSRFFLGSTAERLALHSPYPVWIQRGQKIILPKKILVPCDLSQRSVHAIDGTKKLGLSKTPIKLFHIIQPPQPVLDYPLWQLMTDQVLKLNARKLEDFKRKHKGLKVVEALKNDVVKEIEKESKEFDLIAISPREHKGMFPSFGSVTSKVVRTGNTSVLVIP